MAYETPLLNERETTHGAFAENAYVSQAIKDVMREGMNWDSLTCIQREALDYIAGKIGRILAGRANHNDHWDDIAGYAKLVSEAGIDLSVRPPP
jgi:hypothetical protein